MRVSGTEAGGFGIRVVWYNGLCGELCFIKKGVWQWEKGIINKKG